MRLSMPLVWRRRMLLLRLWRQRLIVLGWRILLVGTWRLLHTVVVLRLLVPTLVSLWLVASLVVSLVSRVPGGRGISESRLGHRRTLLALCSLERNTGWGQHGARWELVTPLRPLLWLLGKLGLLLRVLRPWSHVVTWKRLSATGRPLRLRLGCHARLRDLSMWEQVALR